MNQDEDMAEEDSDNQDQDEAMGDQQEGNRGSGSRVNIAEAREVMKIQEWQVAWGKLNWRTVFDLYLRYDSKTKPDLTTWNKLLKWLFTALSEENMSHVQAILRRMRTHTSGAPRLAAAEYHGNGALQLENNVIRDYHNVMRSVTTAELSTITLRLHLAKLYLSHTAYVVHLWERPMKKQTAQNKVNNILYDFFNKEVKRTVSRQTIGNQVKEGRHWEQLLCSQETRQFGFGLMILLPVTDFTDIARKTSDDAWTFLLHKIPKVQNLKRLTDLAKALQPVTSALERERIGEINTPMIGFELRSPTNLHNVSATNFEACLKVYPNLGIIAALRTIVAHPPTCSPDKIPELIMKEWELKNQRDGNAMLDRAEAITKSAARDSLILQREGEERLRRTDPEQYSRSMRPMEMSIESQASSSSVSSVQPEVVIQVHI